jgi:hypothetical protein
LRAIPGLKLLKLTGRIKYNNRPSIAEAAASNMVLKDLFMYVLK